MLHNIDDMNSYFSICSNKLFWMKEIFMHPNLSAAWKKCYFFETCSRNELLRVQDAKLKGLLFHAATTVPYYKDFFAEKGISVDKLTLADFPIIEKKDIRGHEQEFVSKSKGLSKIIWSRTSGSTGEPFRFGRSEFDYAYATLWRGMLRYGIRPGDKRVLVKGVDESTSVSLKTKIKRWIYGVLNRCIVVDAHFLAKSKDNILKELYRIVKYKPVYIHGYANSIYLLARTAEENGIALNKLNIKAVVTESEKCHDFQRELIGRVFNAPVVENYGCVEFGMIAQPARDGLMCINEDHVVVETLNDGSAVFTNLDEYAFPLIRYKNGDELKLGEVHNQLSYRTINEISGRKTETIKLPNGGSLHGFIPMYPISKHVNWMTAYQIYQPDLHTLKIRIVPSREEFPQEIKTQIISEMRTIVGNDMVLKFDFVDEIPLSKRGKRLFIVSDVV